jgi:hypothetical protein
MTARRSMPSGGELPPDGSDYWDRFAARIDAAVAARRTRGNVAWLGAHGARVGGVGMAAAALLLVWALTQPAPPATSPVATWPRSLAPSDSLGRTLVVDQPPALGAFILATARIPSGTPMDRPR